MMSGKVISRKYKKLRAKIDINPRRYPRKRILNTQHL